MWFLLLSLIFVLSGCQSAGGSQDGLFNTYFVQPLISVMDYFAELFHGNYGLSIILVTILIRFAVLPLTVKQTKSSQAMKGKMEQLKPEMEAIQAKLNKTSDPIKKQEIQQQLLGLYQKHGVNPLNIGCLPMLIQMPILMAIYYAIKNSPEIATHGFLWFNLGQSNIIMALIAGAIYYLQFKVSMTQLPKEQQAAMKFMGLLSPVMILAVSVTAPAALPLYWSVSGLFLIIQTVISQKKFKPVSAVTNKPGLNK
ncbi:membrane protein insertase YidC [Cytobacillus horneckiae]|uniref:membrane protein insertase YidC n=1 Tax=Cytobacillus horneckiae TaxID=549687 RepID=UPI002DBFD19D|nr:membrane protein insertase YidC [Cytobacillus horneckiae]MEC1157111.1 membrane protein insertase YidC [Cytobacillus horneckiae]MED2939863.1 membrane protein insertase YidC [Cytobacillus horneckiae]